MIMFMLVLAFILVLLLASKAMVITITGNSVCEVAAHLYFELARLPIVVFITTTG